MLHKRTICLIGALLFVASECLAQQVSDKAPSPTLDSPVPLAVGEVVKGRLGNSQETGKSHYWLVDLPAGNYKAVIDIRRADEADSNVGGSLDWYSADGQKMDQLGLINENPNDRYRGVFRFAVKRQFKAIIRYSNFFTVSDYWLGIFKSDAPITMPFFARTPPVETLKLNEPVTAGLDGAVMSARDAYYSVRLPAGDYKITTDYRRADGTSGNVGGSVSLLDSDGGFKGRVNLSNAIDSFDRQVGKLSLADESMAIFKVRAFFGKEMVTLKVQPAGD
jgi:hypothetical protein